jgi:hypothetical protein
LSCLCVLVSIAVTGQFLIKRTVMQLHVVSFQQERRWSAQRGYVCAKFFSSWWVCNHRELQQLVRGWGCAPLADLVPHLAAAAAAAAAAGTMMVCCGPGTPTSVSGHCVGSLLYT